MALLPYSRDGRGVSAPYLWSQLCEDTISTAMEAFFNKEEKSLKTKVQRAENGGVES